MLCIYGFASIIRDTAVTNGVSGKDEMGRQGQGGNLTSYQNDNVPGNGAFWNTIADVWDVYDKWEIDCCDIDRQA